METIPLSRSHTETSFHSGQDLTDYPGPALSQNISRTSLNDYERLLSLAAFASSVSASMEILRSDPTIISRSSGSPIALLATLVKICEAEIVAQRAHYSETPGARVLSTLGNSRMRRLRTSLATSLKSLRQSLIPDSSDGTPNSPG